MADIAQPNDPGTGGDWWSDNAPPAPTGPVTSDNDPRLSNGAYASDPAVLAWLNRSGGPGDTNKATMPMSQGSGPPTLNRNDPNSVNAFISYYANQPGANPSLKNDPGYWAGKISSGELGEDPNYIIGKFMTPEGAPAGSNGFGAPPNQYASNPAAPQYVQPATPANLSQPYQVQGTAPSAPNFTPYKAPSLADLIASPGYKARLDATVQAQQRAAAGRGTVLNGGSQIELAKRSEDYASNEYNNLYGQGLATNQNNNSLLQTGFGDSLSSFNSTNQFGLNARQQNQNEFQQNVVQPAQQTFQNQYQSYLNENARTLNDYLTNYNIKHTAETDEWGRTNDVANRGLQAAASGRAA